MNAKAMINLKEGLIELEGSEDFVTKRLDNFKDLANAFKDNRYPNEEKEAKIPSVSPAIPLPDKLAKKKENGGKPVRAKNIEPEKFDYHKDDKTESLNDFFAQKNPSSSTGDIIAVIGYYIQYKKGAGEFREGQIDFAYRALELKGRPKHLHQIIINNKNQRDLFEEVEEKPGTWKLTRAGEIFVEEKLPKLSKK